MDITLFVLTVVIIGAAIDVTTGLIPNWLTVAGAVGGISLHSASGGMSGFVGSITGLCVGMALLLGFYACGGMGAGDVKLMGAVGSCLGPLGVIHAALATGILGGMYALAVGCRHWGMLATFRYIVTGCRTIVLTGGMFPGAISAASSRLLLRYGIAIALGTTLSLWWREP